MGELSMTAEEAIARLRERAWSSCPPGLERTRALLSLLGNPEQSLKFIHITGTNGKGSTAAILASVLHAAGYRTGLFTSPHLYRFHERMQVNGEMISDEMLAALTQRVLEAADALTVHPTEFELMTALGMLYFEAMHCDIVVLEVGMGGRLDSTNVIPAPEAAVITNIGLEHTAILGDTLEKIAQEKSGIIKSGCRAVLYAQTQGVTQVVDAACRTELVPLTITAPETLEKLERRFRHKFQ
ncbi:MAG: Mur ligase family protein, partial [Eubacteriales bacterium]|nr:Mur ligase family protein [Eubacteriales bacterium]